MKYLALLLFIVIGLAACQTIQDSEQFYEPLTLSTYPPKPDTYVIPVLGGPPDKPFTVIGKMGLMSANYKRMITAIRYNARRVGADAVILSHGGTLMRPYAFSTPGSITNVPTTTSTTAYGSGGWATATSVGSVPVYQPGTVDAGVIPMAKLTAYMIKFK